MLAVTLIVVPVMGAASACPGPSDSSSSGSTASSTHSSSAGIGGSGMGAGEAKCLKADVARPGSTCCAVGTSTPFAEDGLVVAHTITECQVPPDGYYIEVYLKWGVENTADDYEIVDQCSQWETSDLGQKCKVATACTPGYYEVVWDMGVTYGETTSTSRENGGDYQKYISYDTCKATRAT